MSRLVVGLLGVVGVVVEVDVGATGGGLGEGRDGGDEGVDEVSEPDEEGEVANEASGGTTPDEVGGNPEVVVIGPVVLAEPRAPVGGANEGAVGNAGGEALAGAGEEGSAVNDGVVGAVREGVEDLGDEGDVLVVNNNDQGVGDHGGGEAKADKGEGVAGLAEERGETEANDDEGDGEVEREDPGLLTSVELGVGVGGVPVELLVNEGTGEGGGHISGLLEILDLGPVEKLGVLLEERNIVTTVVEGGGDGGVGANTGRRDGRASVLGKGKRKT